MSRENPLLTDKAARANAALLLTVILVAGLALRLVNIQLPFIVGRDDAVVALTAIPYQFSDPSQLSLAESFRLDGHPALTGRLMSPATNLLIGLSYLSFGVDEWQARLPSLGAALAAILVAYRLVRRVAPMREALMAAAALSALPLSGLCSRDVGGLPLAWMSLFLSLLFYTRYRADGFLIDLLRTAFFASVAGLSTPLALPFLPLLGLLALWQVPGRLRTVLVFLVALGGSAALYGRLLEPDQMIAAIDLRQIPALAGELWALWTSPLCWVALVVCLLGLIRLVTAGRQHPDIRTMVLLLTISSVIGLLLFSGIGFSFSTAIGILVPPLSLLGGLGFSLLWGLRVRYLSRWFTIAMIAALFLSAGLQRIQADAISQYDKTGLRIGLWVAAKKVKNWAVRSGPTFRLQRQAAEAAFYAHVPLFDGKFSHAGNPTERSSPPDCALLLVPAVAEGYPAETALRGVAPDWQIVRREQN